MKRLYKIPDDFEAIIHIYSEAEGGRRSPAYNGIRWDFAYADVPPDLAGENLHMIYPDFHDANGDSLDNSPLPTDIELQARMIVLVDEMRENVHRKHIRKDVRFYCCEGAKRAAEGRVMQITGLHKKRPENQSLL